MKRRVSVNLGNLLLSLSDGMDLASPLLTQHQQRTAFIAWELAKASDLPEPEIETIFVAALLHDVGALSLAEKVALHESETTNMEPHCIRGAELLATVPWLEGAADIVRYHHREWCDWDEPISAPRVYQAQMVFLADVVERGINRDQYILHQNHRLIEDITAHAKTHIHPDIVATFVEMADREDFWLDLTSPRLYSLLLHEGPCRRMNVNLMAISSIAELFRSIVDFRSPFTSAHSIGVATCAQTIAQFFGLTAQEVQLMRVAGDLHDLGKLGISNDILEKPAGLTSDEYAHMKSHTYFTYMLLNTIDGLEQISEWAAFHHERLDGSGYPFRCSASDLTTGARIMMVADIFTALAEDRPYRKKMDRDKITKILKDFLRFVISYSKKKKKFYWADLGPELLTKKLYPPSIGRFVTLKFLNFLSKAYGGDPKLSSYLINLTKKKELDYHLYPRSYFYFYEY